MGSMMQRCKNIVKISCAWQGYRNIVWQRKEQSLNTWKQFKIKGEFIYLCWRVCRRRGSGGSEPAAASRRMPWLSLCPLWAFSFCLCLLHRLTTSTSPPTAHSDAAMSSICSLCVWLSASIHYSARQCYCVDAVAAACRVMSGQFIAKNMYMMAKCFKTKYVAVCLTAIN